MIRIFFWLLLCLPVAALAQSYPLHYINTGTDASFRGLSVADAHAVWVSGSKGWVGRTTDGGNTWHFKQVPGYEACDFRSVYAFDANTAIIANAGTPAYILRTADGGNTWQQVYENRDSAAFIDGIDFWKEGGHRHGLVHGDPIKGHMLLLATHNRGKTWQSLTGPQMQPGEASFAASGTNISCYRHSTAVVASGGAQANLYFSRSRGRRWRTIATPMLQGAPSQGIYSFSTGMFAGHWLIVGGDYKNDTISTGNFFYTTNKGKQWQRPATTPRGYRECLAYTEEPIPAKKPQNITIYAVGPTGIDISPDAGKTWQPLNDDKGFHVIKPSADQSRLFLSGASGKLAIMELPVYVEIIGR